MAYKSENKTKRSTGFNSISIGLASPDEILHNSHGEVTKPETINYRTYKPERDGLFCEHIFGPTKDYECYCGKYKRIRYRGIVCERCGVEVTEKKVRRERMGHIRLVVPIVHIWYLRSLPSKIALLLGIPAKRLESIIYYERYVVINAGEMDGTVVAGEEIHNGSIIDEAAYAELMQALPEGNSRLEDDDPNKFICKMGGEAIYDLLARLDLEKLSYALRDVAHTDNSSSRRLEALKRLQIINAFLSCKVPNRPEWMVLHVLPVIPPEIRPLIPLDGGRFATSDVNELYRRVIIRNNRLRRLIEIKAPDVILRNEKRMLQEAVDSLFGATKKALGRSELARPLKSLSDNLKGKTGRFRQNLLGKRVDYSARSVIVVGPELRMHECGLPKDMALELYKPFVIRRLLERGVVKTVKSAKKVIARKLPVVWDILEYIMLGHPVLLNRAPTLHRHGILAFQPKLIEGKAIQLHPLACSGFNADFDGDQMAVHLPLSNAAILEAQLLMLGSHNVLDPANGNPITVPSQDMILGLYYITKELPGAKGEGLLFGSKEEVMIALNERVIDIHALVRVRMEDNQIIETTAGRIMANSYLPKGMPFENTLITKGKLKGIISKVIRYSGCVSVAEFLDGIKSLGYNMSFRGGLSFNLDDILIPDEKEKLIAKGNSQIANIMDQYNSGEMGDDERYNSVVNTWSMIDTEITEALMESMSGAQQGFNSVYMMMDSGARGSKQQIKQLAGIRGLMAKPQKGGALDSRQTIENPILSNFKEGLSVLEYFISTHGARKGLADTALKTADAGYLTRRLVDVAHDVIITEEDCGTLRGLTVRAIEQDGAVSVPLRSRILGRTALQDIVDSNGKLIVAGGEEISESVCDKIEEAGIAEVEIRSVLTCESRRGVCAKCYGRNLATRALVQQGEAVGVIAAQAIGEPGTQLTLRTFHSGGVAGNTAVANSFTLAKEGKIEIEELRLLTLADGSNIVVSHYNDLHVLDKKGNILQNFSIPYGARLYITPGKTYPEGTLVCEWDAYKTMLIIEYDGQVKYRDLSEGINTETRTDPQTGKREIYITESKDKTKIPAAEIVDKKGNVLCNYILPVHSVLVFADGATVKKGDYLYTQSRSMGTAGDITGGLPRVTELFEARNSSNAAVVSEIDGFVSLGKIKRGNREIIITSRVNENVTKNYLVPLGRQLLVQDGDYVRAGICLCDGVETPSDILDIKGPTAVQEYIVNEAQSVYRLQGVEIDDKHFEVIVRQMMKKVEIIDAGDTNFMASQLVDKLDFLDENDRLFGKKIVTDPGDSENLQKGQMVNTRRLHDENSALRRKDKMLVTVRDTIPATAKQVLQGVTKAALGTKSFMSAASFQETTKVLNESAIAHKTDYLLGMKENVICGNLIPAGTGFGAFDRITVTSKENEK